MRAFLYLWFIPLIVFWGWYALSANDVGGVFFLTRKFHDHLFSIYGTILHMPPEEVPEKIAWIFAFDSLLVLGLAALRWYKRWLPGLVNKVKSAFGIKPENDHGQRNTIKLEDTSIMPRARGLAGPAE